MQREAPKAFGILTRACYKAASREECPVGYRVAERPLRSRLRTRRPMDLNYLYQRHQVSLFMAEHAGCEEARLIHREFADRYAAQIADRKRPHSLLRVV